MTVEEQLVRLNKVTWLVMTLPEVYNKSNYVNIAQVVDELYEDGYEVVVGDSKHSYTIGELRVIDRLIAWITQITYAHGEIENQKIKHNQFADYDKYYQMITEAEESLKAYRKLHPDGIDFFIKSDWNKVTLKHCHYYLFQELLLYKVGFLTDRIDGLF